MNGFSVFKNKWFSLYYLSATLSKIGDNVYRFAIPFIVLEMTDSVAYMTAMWVAEIAPFIVLGPFLGVLVDRLDRRKIMLWSDFMRAVLIILLPTLSFLHMLDLWVLFAVGFLLSIFTICFDLVADFGLIPQLVKSGDLTKANAYFRSMDELSRMVGPVIAGAVIALVGAQTSLFIDALSYFFTLAVIWFIPINFNIGVKIEEPMSVRNVLKDISEGFIHIFRSKILWVLALVGCSVNLALGALFTVMIYHLGSELGMNAAAVGSIYSMIGVITLIGAALAPMMLRYVTMGKAIVISCLASFVGSVVLALAAQWVISLIGYCFIMIGSSMMNIYTFTVRQREIPSAFMGRINSAYRMILTVSFPISAAILGGLANSFGSRAAFIASMLFMMVTVSLVVFTKVTSYSEKEQEMEVEISV